MFHLGTLDLGDVTLNLLSIAIGNTLHFQLQKWIKNGLEEIDKISKKEILEYDMWGQTLGAIISLDKVTIYWGDEEYPDDYLEFDQLKIILSNWYDFLLSEPNISTLFRKSKSL
mgnify:CR=1 FL=1